MSLLDLFTPAVVHAHEVYVLTPEEVQTGLATPPFDSLSVIMGDMHSFMFWALAAAFLVFVIFGASIVRPFERKLMPFFMRLKKYAPHISRITIGIAFIASAWFGASYGPELPLAPLWGMFTPLITAILAITGALIIAGMFVRTAAFVGLVVYMINVSVHGSYMLTYANYLGEIIVLLILGAHSFHHSHAPHHHNALTRAYLAFAHKAKPYAFPILRICFGASLLYASIYAKFLHNDLALQVAQLPLAGHLTSVASALGFEPHFLVVGAGIVEVVIALFFMLGIEIRFTSLFLEFWLALSLIYFGESVWPHLILIGIPIAFICYGYDRFSLEGWLFKKHHLEPVL